MWNYAFAYAAPVQWALHCRVYDAACVDRDSAHGQCCVPLSELHAHIGEPQTYPLEAVGDEAAKGTLTLLTRPIDHSADDVVTAAACGALGVGALGGPRAPDTLSLGPPPHVAALARTPQGPPRVDWTSLN